VVPGDHDRDSGMMVIRISGLKMITYSGLIVIS
jgi:hypothetical protein